MKIAVTGTPGVGKTSVGKKLAEKLGLNYLSVNDLAREEGCILSKDEERDTDVVEIDELREVTSGLEDCILDGHLSHFLENDKTFVLRCKPSVLKKRLEGKGWNESKVQENVDAEILGVIEEEARKRGGEVYSVDTTDRDVEEVVRIVEGIVNDEVDKGEWIEPIDWMTQGERGD